MGKNGEKNHGELRSDHVKISPFSPFYAISSPRYNATLKSAANTWKYNGCLNYETILKGCFADFCAELDFLKAVNQLTNDARERTFKVVHWIRSFVSNRTQYCCHKSLKSLISGVPQGTVLGPILFIIYINDIIKQVSHSTIRCFADDSGVCKM